MASRTFRITSYEVFLGSKLLRTAQGPSGPRAVPAQAIIQCFGAAGESFAIFFLNEDRNTSFTKSDEWPNYALINEQKVVAEMFVPVAQYAWYLDVLRNEDLVFATIDDSTPHLSHIWRK